MHVKRAPFSRLIFFFPNDLRPERLSPRWRETYKYFIRSNWITGELLVTIIFIFLVRTSETTLSPPPRGEDPG